MDKTTDSTILAHKIDRYSAATIDHQQLPDTDEKFDQMLGSTLKNFREVYIFPFNKPLEQS